MGRLFDSPVHLLILVVVILLVFGAPKLPGMARSLGQSMRIFKSEVEGMKKDSKKNATPTATSEDEVVSGEVIDNKPSHTESETK
ncbi:Sec-independent protein translocase subunit TatA [Rothia sp. CCM 9418]|uniref:Sec-independent protein translocase subunit TatA n=1 Tax=unclassified Rothia (in: high G+C Gram-positive bacteria) TaxID=2689056 RepID=UPI003AC59035